MPTCCLCFSDDIKPTFVEDVFQTTAGLLIWSHLFHQPSGTALVNFIHTSLCRQEGPNDACFTIAGRIHPQSQSFLKKLSASNTMDVRPTTLHKCHDYCSIWSPSHIPNHNNNKCKPSKWIKSQENRFVKSSPQNYSKLTFTKYIQNKSTKNKKTEKNL